MNNQFDPNGQDSWAYMKEQKLEASYQPRTHLSITTLCKFASCPRKYFYYAHSLQTDGSKGPFLFGEAMHLAFPIILQGGTVEEAFEAFLTLWNKPELEDKKRNAENALMILANYAATHSINPLTRKPNGLYSIEKPPSNTLEISDRVSDFEVPFAIDIGLPVPLVGRIDGLCRHRDTGELWALEFKTTSGDPYGNLSDNFLRAFDKNPQTVGYTTVLRTMTGEPIRGCMLDATLVSARKQDSMTYPVYVSEQESAEWIEWALFYGRMLLEMERKYLESNDPKSFPKFFTGCHPYSTFGTGGFTCDFKIMCDQEDYRSMLPAFEVSKKEPFTIKPKEVTINGTEQA